MPELKISILAGQDTKQFLASLTKQLDRLEKLAVKLSPEEPIGEDKEEVEDEEPVEVELESDADFTTAPKKPANGGKKAKSFDEEEEEESDEEVEEVEDDEEEETAKPAKEEKTKKITVDDVNDACKALAASIGGKKGRTEVLGILKKKFKTESVSELDPKQYAKCIEAMQIEQ